MVYQVIISVAKISWQQLKPLEPPHQEFTSAIMANKSSTANLVLKIHFPNNATILQENYTGKVQQKLNSEQKLPSKLINHTLHWLSLQSLKFKTFVHTNLQSVESGNKCPLMRRFMAPINHHAIEKEIAFKNTRKSRIWIE